MRASSGFAFKLCVAIVKSCVLVLMVGAQPESRGRVEASLVSLPPQCSLQDALKEFARTGNRVVDLRPRLGQEVTNPTLMIDITRRPFLLALDAVCAAARLKALPFVDPATGELTVGLLSRDDGEPPPAAVAPVFDGPFRISINQVAGVRNLRDARQSHLTVTLGLEWEPRYRPLLLRLRSDSIQVVNADGQEVRVDTSGMGTVKLAGEASVELSLRMPLPPRSTARLGELRGRMQMLVPPREATFSFRKLAAGEREQRDALTATLTRFQADRDLWVVGIALAYPAGTLDLESHQTWAMEANRIWLVHKADGKLRGTRLNPEISIDEGRAVRINYHFAGVPGKPEDWELRYEAPAPPRVYPLEFSFKELPLP